MVFDNSELAAGMANLAVRALNHQIRQATTDSASASATSSSLLPSSTVPSSTVASPTPSETSGNSGTGSGNNNGGNSGSSPLLFFVALGFGVVFTNLW